MPDINAGWKVVAMTMTPKERAVSSTTNHYCPSPEKCRIHDTPTPIDPADRLREAAQVLRERAEACLPRQGDDQSWAEAFDADAYEQEHGGDGASDVRYIATMHPGVGLALADWLDWMGRALVGTSKGDVPFEDVALRLADLILGAES